jgi:hypothetical protein
VWEPLALGLPFLKAGDKALKHINRKYKHILQEDLECLKNWKRKAAYLPTYWIKSRLFKANFSNFWSMKKAIVTKELTVIGC